MEARVGVDIKTLGPSPLPPLPPRGGEIFGEICLINCELLSSWPPKSSLISTTIDSIINTIVGGITNGENS